MFRRFFRGASVTTLIFTTFGLLGLAPRPEERVLLFPTIGVFNSSENLWELEFHGWVFQPEEGSLKRQLLLSMLSKSLKLSPEEERNTTFQTRARPFLVDNKEGRVISIEIGGRPYNLGPSGENGHFIQTIKLTVQDVEAAVGEKTLSGIKRLPFLIKIPTLQDSESKREILLVSPEGHSIISDLDDTLKISEVSNRKSLLQNTFLRDFEAVPGMSESFQKFATKDMAIHVVTAAPWQVYPSLKDFFEREKLPVASIDMKYFRWKDSSFFDLFAKSDEIKRPSIEALLQKFPKRKFTFIGDSGEGDAELYADLFHKYPQQIEKIWIRNASLGASPPPSLVELPKDRWAFFSDAKELLK